MFKHLLILLIILIVTITISYYIIKKLLLTFHKLILSKFIIKYNLIDFDKQFLNLYSEEFDIHKLKSLNDKTVFYTDIQWNTKNNNYIFDVINKKYYIITHGYYYYIDSSENFKITIGSPNGKVKLFNNNINNNKVSFLENNNISSN